MSSRVIVKNLPQKCSEEKLREVFSGCGEVTDVRLMKTRSGTFRKFGFVGFQSAEQAQYALKQLNKTYIGTARIELEEAKPYGDHTLSRPWSKYSKGSSAHKDSQGERKKEHKEKGNDDSGHEGDMRTALLKEYEEIKDDPKFQEYLKVTQHKSKTNAWSDDVGTVSERGKGRGHGLTVTVDKEDVSNVVDREREGEEEEGEGEEEKIAMSVHISDLDYLKSKIVREASAHTSAEESEGHASADEDGTAPSKETTPTTPYTVKMLGLPFRAKEKDVHTFFHPLKVAAVRFTQDSGGRPSGRAYADFLSESDLRRALKRNKDCIFHRYIELFRDRPPAEKGGGKVQKGGEQLRPWEVKASAEDLTEEEDITESGRIFVRNLPYSTREEEVSELFGTHGPLTEVTVPLDKDTNKSKGLAFVTFMLPEHAAKAHQELDGQIFQGRLLHLLPARSRRERVEESPSSFKKKKDQKLRSEAGRGHNWNTLFLGANAVVDVMAGKYSAEKSDILDPSGPGTSAAVRLALGETEIVRETRQFLQRHGVNLEVFEQSKPERSKTVILVKNLASGTTNPELSKLFQTYGQLIQVVMPPAGISALVEFAEPSHAKQAFSKLAYTNFKHLPLYLEWAPVGVLQARKTSGVGEARGSEEEGEEGEGEAEATSVFVKNLNFSTDEDSLGKLFSDVAGVKSVSIARKKNPKDPATPLSMGFGFVGFESEKLAREAIKVLQHCELEGHSLQLKLSSHNTRKVSTRSTSTRKQTRQKSAKILVRNIPFEASKREVKELFDTFGSLKTVRLPRKASVGSGEHRGFGFVEFVTKEDAKRAFEALSLSTHLYGRRLVLEWAEPEESLEAVRKRTALHFHGFKPKRTKVSEQMLTDVLDKSEA